MIDGGYRCGVEYKGSYDKIHRIASVFAYRNVMMVYGYRCDIEYIGYDRINRTVSTCE